MSTKRYFELLGISPTKNEKIIKRAYRKKAMKYHPDRNPTLEAKNKFIQVTEAYDNILLALERANNPRYSQSTQRRRTRTKAPSNQSKNSNYNQQYSSENKAKEERVKNARARYEKVKRKEAEENERYFQKMTSGRMWKQFKTIVIISSLLSFLIVIDTLYLPTETVLSSIQKSNIKIEYRGKGGVQSSPVLFTNGQKVWVPYHIINRGNNHFLYLERTLLMKDVKFVKYWNRNKWNYYVPDYSLIDSFPWIPIVLLFPMFSYFIKNRNMFFSICFHSTLYLCPIILTVLLISNDRWVHILTLGFL